MIEKIDFWARRIYYVLGQDIFTGGAMYFNWRIETIKFESGERYPLLVNREDGMPLFKPTVYSTSMLRNKGNAEATTMSSLRAIMFLYTWGLKHRIDIEERFRKGDFLKLNEIEKLCSEVSYRYNKLFDDIPDGRFGKIKPNKLNIRRKRRLIPMILRKGAMDSYCDAHGAGTRLRYIRNYLDWLAGQRMARVSEKSPDHAILHLARQNMKKEINARIPKAVRGTVKDPIFRRLGLTKDVENILIAALDPESPRNPFKQKHVKVRNQLIVRKMLHTGIRRGEALGIRTTDGDLDLQKNTVTIHRMPVDPLDSRLHKPQTKTSPRTLPIENELSKLARKYMLNYRRKLPMAGMHPFLFVESRKGKPLSLAALNDIFAALRDAIPELPRNFSPHFCRYTWNDRFSELADEKIRKNEWTKEDEHEARCLQMGWSKDSKMATLYSIRHIKAKADEFSIKRQEELFRHDAE